MISLISRFPYTPPIDYSAQQRRDTRPDKKIVGNLGEDLAEKFLLRLGYEIRDRNIRLGRDEIDILAFDPVDNALVFVEVKTRSSISRNFGPELDTNHRKLAKMRRSARRWVKEHGFEGGYRLDAVYVVEGKVTEHIKELDWGEETD